MVVLIMVSGGLGALARFILDGFVRTRLGRGFPWGTMLINISGSLLLGILIGFTLNHQEFSNICLIIGTGFCGGYTTFSTMSFETVRLIEMHQFGKALFNMLGTLSVALASAELGIIIGLS